MSQTVIDKEIIAEALEHSEYDIPQRTQELLQIMAVAMERFIPKKPKATCITNYYECPDSDCGKLMEKRESKHGDRAIPHCKWCGQALDWGDEDGDV